MTLDPQAAELLAKLTSANLPAIHEQSPEAARQQMRDGSAVLGPPADVDSVTDRTIEGPCGEIPIRVYRPAGSELPVVVYFHGGGWVIGGVDTHDGYCRALANAAHAVVVSVDYRLAPEETWPAAAEDCYAAMRWVSNHCLEIGARPDALAVAGDSAGGNLAAVTALMARDRNGPEIALQVLIYPITDHDFDTPSYREFTDGFYLTRETMIWFWDQYCPPDVDRDHAYLAPLRAEDLEGLPPALVLTAECDPLCDEGEAYADRLNEAGVDVTKSRYAGMIHGFIRRFDCLDPAHQALAEIAAAIKDLP